MTLKEKVMSILKLDEAGKISKFFDSLVKDAKRNIAQLEANKKAEILAFDQEKDELKEEIEDAEEAVDAAYEAVTLDDIKNNATIDQFKSIYLKNVLNCEATVKRLKERIKALEENHKERMEEMNEQIGKYQARIVKFTEELK